MPPAPPPRPSIYNLQRFLLGTLPPAEAATVAAWVESSPDAARALAGIAAHDALTQAVASTVGLKPPPASVVARVVGNVTGSYVPAAESVPNVSEQTRPSGPAAPRPGVPSAAPDRLGPFRLVRELGRGGMGVVFEALDEHLGRRAAVKVLAPDLADNPEARQRFLREGRAAADLKSDHIVTIYQVGEADGVPFLAMEFIEGVTLEAWRKTRPGPVAVEDVLWVARDLLSGLSVAHKKGRVHRDVKPANALIERETRRVKILDFGLTRGSEAGDQLTSVGRVIGTPAFMSPEQAHGKPVDVRSDLFSAGVTLYALVTGSSPFRRDTLIATVLAVGTEEVPPLAALPGPLRAFVARLMSKSPSDRPADAGAALAELLALEARIQAPPKRPPLKPPPLPPPQPGPVAPPGLPVTAAPTRSRRTRNRVLLATVAVLLVAVVAVVATSGGDKPRSDEGANAPKSGGSDPPPGPAPGRGSLPGGAGGTPLPDLPTLTPGAELTFDGTIRRGELTAANTGGGAYVYNAQMADGRSQGFNTSFSITYSVSFEVSLKAGQRLAATATAVGKERGMLLVLIDPTGKAVDGTELRPRTATVRFHEVSATGRYHILVASERIGDFFLRLTDPAGATDPAALEADLARQKDELAKAEAALKALKAP